MQVWLHVGASKTGTSALQVALARERQRLAEVGLWYPQAMCADTDRRALAGQTTSGNAVELGRLVNPELRPAASVDREATLAWLRRALTEAEGKVLLLSSETLQVPDPVEGSALAALLTTGGRELRILYFVRHALDHCVAHITQWLKNGIANKDENSLDSAVARWMIPFNAQLEAWAKVAGEQAICCRNYDEDRGALLERLLQTVHPPAAVALRTSSQTDAPLVNRSPTASELRLLQRLNVEPDASALCRWLVDGVLSAPAAVPDPLRVSESAFAAFEDNNRARIKAVNARWLLPAGRLPLSLSSGRIGIGLSDLRETEEAFAACFIAAARRMEQERQAMRKEIAQLQSELAHGKNSAP